MKINDNFTKLQGSYLFSEIARRVADYKEKNPKADVISLGIGDVAGPLVPAIIEAMAEGVKEMSKVETFKGYGPEQGYSFLRDAIAENDFKAYGINVEADEIFVSDGAKCDTGNFQELFSNDTVIAVTDPVYPVYVDSNVMAGRAGNFVDGHYDNLVYLPTTAENNFVPPFPDKKIDVVYICSPNNPTGEALNKDQLKAWVDYARANEVLILFDAAYERFITEENIPHSIYEIEGARECAVEFRSFSKTAGFTGTRCGYTVVPKNLVAKDSNGNTHSLRDMWNRRQCTKFNGASYVVQKAAAAIYTPEGKKQVEEVIANYFENARIIVEGLNAIGIKTYGGVNSPYIWLKTPNNISSWDFFDKLLHEANIVGTPGSGFGPAGEGYFRLTAFNTRENTLRAVERLSGLKF